MSALWGLGLWGRRATCQGAIQYEAVKAPQLHCLVGRRGRQLAHIRAQQAFQDVVP